MKLIYVILLITLFFGCTQQTDSKNETPAISPQNQTLQPVSPPLVKPSSEQPSLQQPTHRVYYGLFTERGFDEIQRLYGKKPSIIQLGIPWEDGAPFPVKQMEGIRKNGAIPDILWSPYSYIFHVSQGGSQTNQPKYQLKKIIRGDFDDYIRKFARDAKKWGKPFFLRFGHEMNGEWYPWSETVNGNFKGGYIQMYRHVHDVFEHECPKCATWVWAPDAGGQSYTPPQDFAELYPGDDYVDWVGLSAYNVEVAKGEATWEEFESIIGPAYGKLQQIAVAKPVYIAETGSVEKGGNKAQWIRKVLPALKNKFPKIRAYGYFDIGAAEQGFPDTRITTSAEATEAFREIISDSYFASNEFSSLKPGPIEPS